MNKLRLLVVAALLPLVAVAQSFNFKAIGDAPAIMYDTPSHMGIKRFIAPPGMPVEVVHATGEWAKVRDVAGDMTWVEAKALGAKRAVIVTATRTDIRTRAEEAAPLAFSAEKGVLLIVTESPASGWIKVWHRDGQGGFVRAADVWGV